MFRLRESIRLGQRLRVVFLRDQFWGLCYSSILLTMTLENFISSVSRFADDFKIIVIVNSDEQVGFLKADLPSISNWKIK